MSVETAEMEKRETLLPEDREVENGKDQCGNQEAVNCA